MAVTHVSDSMRAYSVNYLMPWLISYFGLLMPTNLVCWRRDQIPVIQLVYREDEKCSMLVVFPSGLHWQKVNKITRISFDFRNLKAGHSIAQRQPNRQQQNISVSTWKNGINNLYLARRKSKAMFIFYINCNWLIYRYDFIKAIVDTIYVQRNQERQRPMRTENDFVFVCTLVWSKLHAAR